MCSVSRLQGSGIRCVSMGYNEVYKYNQYKYKFSSLIQCCIRNLFLPEGFTSKETADEKLDWAGINLYVLDEISSLKLIGMNSICMLYMSCDSRGIDLIQAAYVTNG